MKVIFNKYFNFLAQCPKEGDREKNKLPKKAHQVGRQVPQLKSPAAHQQEIAHRSGQDGAQEEKAHPAATDLYGVDKYGHSDGQPKGEIQNSPQYPPVQAYPQHAQQVVQQAHRSAQGQGPQQREGLPGHRNFHRPLPKQPGKKAAPISLALLVHKAVYRSLHL